MHLINDDGNMFDAIFLAAVLAIKNTQVLDVSVVKNQICINDQRRKYLNVHHTPICSTFYFLGDQQKPALDVNSQEEKLCRARLSIVLNSYGDLCGMQTLGALDIGGNNQADGSDEDSEAMQPIYDASELLEYIKIAQKNTAGATKLVRSKWEGRSSEFGLLENLKSGQAPATDYQAFVQAINAQVEKNRAEFPGDEEPEDDSARLM